MRRAVYLGLVAAGTLCLATSASAEGLATGLPSHLVEARLGPAGSVRLERNGVRCWTYTLERDARSKRELVRLLILRSGRLQEDLTVRSEEVRFRCSEAAGRWDTARSRPLVCDPRWSRFC